MRMFECEIGADECAPGQRSSARVSSEREFLSSAEARELLRISKNTLYRNAGAGRIPGALKVGGTWRFRRSALLRWRSEDDRERGQG